MSSLEDLEVAELRRRLEKASTYEERSQIRAALRKLRGSSSSAATTDAETAQSPPANSTAQSAYKRPGFQTRTDPPSVSHVAGSQKALEALKQEGSIGESSGEVRTQESLSKPTSTPDADSVVGVPGENAGDDEVDSGYIERKDPAAHSYARQHELEEAAIRKKIEHSHDYEDRKRLRAQLRALQSGNAPRNTPSSDNSSRNTPFSKGTPPAKHSPNASSTTAKGELSTKARPSSVPSAAWSSTLRKTGVDLTSRPSPDKHAASSTSSSTSANPWGVMLKKRRESEEGRPRAATVSGVDFRTQLKRRAGPTGQRPSTPERQPSVDFLSQLKRSPAVASPTKTTSSPRSPSVDYSSALKPRKTDNSLEPITRTRSATTPAVDYLTVLKTSGRAPESTAYGGTTRPQANRQNKTTSNTATKVEPESNGLHSTPPLSPAGQSNGIENVAVEENHGTGEIDTINYTTDAVEV